MPRSRASSSAAFMSSVATPSRRNPVYLDCHRIVTMPMTRWSRTAMRLADCLGYAQHRLGRYHQAAASYHNALSIRAGVHAEQPEHPRGRAAQLLAGPGENRAHLHGRVPGVQRVQPASGVAQFRGQRGRR